MPILKYNFISSKLVSNSNLIINFKNDLYIHLSSNLYDDELIFTNINKFVKYFESVKNIITNFSNDVDGLEYDVEFELELEFQINSKKNFYPNFILKQIQLNKNYKINKISKQIKNSDYTNITNILDYNNEIHTNTNPYFIVKIIKTENYNIFDNFYKGKYILLKKMNTNEYIEIDFDKYLIYHYDTDKYEDNCENSINLDTHSFKFYNKKLCVNGGPIYKITKLDNENKIMLDNQIYEIDFDSTVDIDDFIL